MERMNESMDWDDVDFCPKIGMLSTRWLVKVLADKVFASKSRAFRGVLADRYVQMGRNYVGVRFDDAKWDLNRVCRNAFDRKKKKDARLAVPISLIKSANRDVQKISKCPDFGHDMPVWLRQKGSNTRFKVMIVSQDPKRKDDARNFLYLSTPFGMHSCCFRCSGGAAMCSIVEGLLCRNVAVYLTDFNKMYAMNPSYVRTHAASLYKSFGAILEQEARQYDPDLIVTFGKEATDCWTRGKYGNVGFCSAASSGFRGCFKGRPAIGFLHISKTGSKYLKRANGNNGCGCQEKYVEKVISGIFKRLKRLDGQRRCSAG